MEDIKTKQSELKLTRDVGDHDEDEEGVVVEGEVVLVRQGDGVEPCFLYVWQRGVDRQKFPRHSHRVQHNKKCVPVKIIICKTHFSTVKKPVD